MKIKCTSFSTIKLGEETIRLSHTGVFKISLLNCYGYVWRGLRFGKRELKSARDLLFTTVFLIACYVLIILWGLSIKKYTNLLDGVWEMKSVLLTTVGIGLFSLNLRDIQTWRSQLKSQYYLRLLFEGEASESWRKLRILMFQKDAAIKMSEIRNYQQVTDESAVNSRINQTELRHILYDYSKFLKKYLNQLGSTQLAGGQGMSESYFNNSISLIRSVLTFDGQFDKAELLKFFNDLLLGFHSIINILSCPWRWDKKLDNRKLAVIKSTMKSQKLCPRTVAILNAKNK
ncbi:hypothetical protein [Lacticaseibacillus paracasei]|uniref:hypothetical protein n=1 Tax=Lacticaseibacillus paracasei TaxID=1597 RepID=UPI0021D0994B|nr:hypothetical protein [Lacticaseibacillus paracasei]MCU6430217.1 hypothetical protein [Lacticaseibacillus paracasei]